MTNIIIIAHAPLASALRQCVAHVFADRLDSVLALDVYPDDTPAHSLVAAQRMMAALGDAPLLLLADVLGATPCNVAQQLLTEHKARLLVGVNLPMLWRAVSYQQAPLDELVSKAMAGAVQGILEVQQATTPIH